MKHLIRLVLLVALLALGWWLWSVFFPGPEKIVRQRMARLAETATFSASDSPIARAAKAQKVAGLFSRDVTVALHVAGYGSRDISGHDELAETATAAFAAIRGLKVEFLDMTVVVAADKRSADVSCTAKIRFEDAKDYGVQEMRFVFKQVEDKWLISRVETVKTLS